MKEIFKVLLCFYVKKSNLIKLGALLNGTPIQKVRFPLKHATCSLVLIVKGLFK